MAAIVTCNWFLDQFWKMKGQTANYFPATLGQTIENMGTNWQSIGQWKLKKKGEMFYIQNSLNNKVLGPTIDDKVVEEDIVGGKSEQLWSKHVINNDGNFTLRNCEAQKLLTANPNGLEIRGMINLKSVFFNFY